MPTKKGEKIESLADLKNAVAISEATKNEMLNKGIEALQKCFSANKTIGGVVLAEKRTPGGKGDVKYYSVAATLILGFTEKASLKSFKLQELCKGIPALDFFHSSNIPETDKATFLEGDGWKVFVLPIQGEIPRNIVELCGDVSKANIRFDSDYEKISLGFSKKYPILEVVDYSAKGFAIFWNGAKLDTLYNKLANLGGQYNKYLSHPLDRAGAKSPAFFFANKKAKEVADFLEFPVLAALQPEED